MIDLIFLGWKAATAWSKWNAKAPEVVEGSVEDVQQIREMTEALYEDNKRLIGLVQEQEKKIVALEIKTLGIEGKIAGGILVAIVFNALIAWGICAAYHH
jgi:hypothetical protein